MVKRLNCYVPDEMHKQLRISLAEDETDFSTWLRGKIETYLAEKGKLDKPKAGRKAKKEA